MSTGRIGRILARWWVFIAAVTLLALVGTVLWSAFGPVTYRAEAELLLVLDLPPNSADRLYGIENSRAQASAVVIEDLGRLASGREVLRLAVDRARAFDADLDLESVVDTIDIFPLARGLRVELGWPDARVAQGVVDAIVDLMLTNQRAYYPSLPEIGALRLVDKTAQAIRPAIALVVLDVVLKTVVAFFAAILVVLLIDWRANRLYAEDVPELLGMHVIGALR
ncbi:MAG: hypothetical protein FJ029_05215 [Actinobacteria bacterium]|nr:hypothetical protein [Actinomycetota bacterium]